MKLTIRQTASAVGAITALSVFLFFFTNWLGPYGQPDDIYHLVILVLVAVMAFVFTVGAIKK
jgi:hypothetical protein